LFSHNQTRAGRGSSLAALLLSLLVPVAAEAQDPKPGTVTGVVMDANTGQHIIGARIYVNGQTSTENVSDTDGRFRLQLSAGTYQLKFEAENYLATVVEQVVVTSGAVTEASTVLTNKNAVTSIDVAEKIGAVAATAETALTERKLAAVVSDAISGQEMAKSSASDAAGALEKVTGISVVGDGYVYVRGLGERYSATMLNNSVITTTEPEKRVVPLDLFPSALIDNIKVLKTYTPDLPGEFSGGLVQLTTVEFPMQKLLKVSSSIGFNTNTTFNRFENYRGSSTDLFGFGAGARALPSGIPTDRRVTAGNFTPAELETLGRSFDVNWESRPIESMRPSQSHSVVAGNTIGKWGLVGALTFSNSPQFTPEFQQYNRPGANNSVVPYNIFNDFQSNNQAARLGAIFNAAYRINARNKIVVRNTLTRDADKEARRFRGYNDDLGTIIENTRLRYIERTLYGAQVEGEHTLPRASSWLLNWQFGYSRSTRDEPDLREVIRGQTEEGQFQFLGTAESGQRFFNNLKDRVFEPGASLSRPFYRGKVAGVFRFGTRLNFRERDFDARRFRFFPVSLGTVDRLAPSNELFSPANVRRGVFELREETRATDAYRADMQVYSGFAMVDLGIGTKLRLVGGLRVERANQNVVTIDPFSVGRAPIQALLQNTDPLPGVNLIYALRPTQNLRFGYSRTLSRPDFRELSPFDFTNVQGGFTAVGNPNLRRSRIDNFDARWEWFPSATEIVAVSYFYKIFDDPIETTIQPTAALRQTYINADGARNQGIELEYRKNLGAYLPALRTLTLGSNFTWVDSQIQLTPEQQGILTSRSRPMAGQSRYIFNGNLEWAKPSLRSKARFYANYVSRRLTDVGALGLPDIYQEANAVLDFVYEYSLSESGKWTMRFNAENLTDNYYNFTQGSQPFRNYRVGRTFTIGTSYTFF
jgi:outer membrane receptor protein involved in Fe transport